MERLKEPLYLRLQFPQETTIALTDQI